MTRFQRISSILPALAFSAVLAGAASAQIQTIFGRIQGEVFDPGGAAIPGATVEADEVDTGIVHRSTTGTYGHFEFPSLQPGRYVVKIAKSGFANVTQENLNLTVGLTTTLKLTMPVGGANESVVVSAAPLIDVTTTVASTTLGEATVANTPELNRKFEDLLTLTPGVSISQGPDGDEININGQRGIFNNISLDGGDYNNGFFGEQSGGQRAAVDITLEAIKEFQVVASGANAEFGRTGGGVVNVITKSGTNDFHGSAFEFQRLQALALDASDGTPLTNFHREQFGGSAGGHIIRDKLFFFTAGEGIDENLLRSNLSTYNATAVGSTPCAIANPVFRTNITDTQIDANGDCQRQVLLNFYQTNFHENEGAPVDHVVHNAAIFGRGDWNLNSKNLFYVSYNFDRSRNPNQTFDVPTYGTTANGIEGPSHVHTLNGNLLTTISERKLNEAHMTFGHETRPRTPIDPTAVPDTGIGFSPSFRFGQPFFLGPDSSETFYHLDGKDNFSLVRGHHTLKMGFEYLYSHNVQVFDGFALGRYIFGSTSGFLHYASPAALGNGYGPNTTGCTDGTYTTTTCVGNAINTGSPLLLYLQDTAVRANETVQQAGYSSISNKEPALFLQDTWQLSSRLTLNYGLRWEAQYFPNPVIPPSQTAYSVNLSDPRFPSAGYLPNQTKEFQPRVGFNYNVRGDGRTVIRGSVGVFNARQNGLTQVGAITTNGVQQQTLTQFSGHGNPVYPNSLTYTPVPVGSYPFQPGVTVFDKNYHNPRIYSYDVGIDQQLGRDYVIFADFNDSKGVYLTRFLNPNVGPNVVLPLNGDTATYTGTESCSLQATPCSSPFPNLGTVTDTASNAKSLYRGVTIGVRKRFSHGFQLDAQYTYSVDRDDDSNERDPFTFRYANLYNLAAEYSLSDRDERHKFNAYGLGNLPFGFRGNLRIQQHSAEPVTDNPAGTGTGPACSYNNSLTRFVNGVDCGRNHLRKDNAFFTTDLGLARPIPFHDGKLTLVPRAELFNAFNNVNNLNPLSSPALFDFSGFLRVGVGDPLQAQLALRLEF